MAKVGRPQARVLREEAARGGRLRQDNITGDTHPVERLTMMAKAERTSDDVRERTGVTRVCV